jgi:hypothetical protein
VEVAESGENAEAEAQAGSYEVEGGAGSLILCVTPILAQPPHQHFAINHGNYHSSISSF